MHSLGIVQWNSTRRDHPGNPGGVSGSGLINCVTPQIFGGHFFFFSYKSSMYFSFTYPKYVKLYCSNIFLQKAAQGHNPTFFLLTASREHRLLVYLKRGGPTTG